MLRCVPADPGPPPNLRFDRRESPLAKSGVGIDAKPFRPNFSIFSEKQATLNHLLSRSSRKNSRGAGQRLLLNHLCLVPNPAQPFRPSLPHMRPSILAAAITSRSTPQIPARLGGPDG